MKKYNIGIVGATGMVGETMLRILEERNFPLNQLKLIASTKSEGKVYLFANKKITVETLKRDSFQDIDIALFTAGGSVSKEYAPVAVSSGAVVIDNSNAFRMDADTPLVVPEINPNKIYSHNGIIANPNCSTIQLVVALKPIYDEVGITRIIVSTYQAVSGSGRKAVDELMDQTKKYIRKDEFKPDVYPYQIAFNVLPHIDVFENNGYTKEEMKIINETKKIFDDNSIKISATAVRVPVLNGHSESVYIETKRYISVEKLRKLLDKAKGVLLVDDINKLQYPLPIMINNCDDVLIGRLRNDLSNINGINMWIVANNIRKGAALNAVQIAEILINRDVC
ncbi:MAG: aspartate-semialdehyde dehydrogenase [Candidatus Cloacimonetes bacterium]|nr:aspartate-semialdehyde dehydrogenase [Candidatus Cloacimonadota bacterium]